MTHKELLKIRNFGEFLYPGQKQFPESQESNDKNGFLKFEVFTAENRLQKFSSIFLPGTQKFCKRFSMVKTSNLKKTILLFGS